jgi:hypothetical protein
MIFAELQYPQQYSEVHAELQACLASGFSRVEDGLQSDSWVWVREGKERVTVDTFTSMQHQVKAAQPSPLVQQVLEVLERRFRLQRFDPPLPEDHE